MRHPRITEVAGPVRQRSRAAEVETEGVEEEGVEETGRSRQRPKG